MSARRLLADTRGGWFSDWLAKVSIGVFSVISVLQLKLMPSVLSANTRTAQSVENATAGMQSPAMRTPPYVLTDRGYRIGDPPPFRLREAPCDAMCQFRRDMDFSGRFRTGVISFFEQTWASMRMFARSVLDPNGPEMQAMGRALTSGRRLDQQMGDSIRQTWSRWWNGTLADRGEITGYIAGFIGLGAIMELATAGAGNALEALAPETGMMAAASGRLVLLEEMTANGIVISEEVSISSEALAGLSTRLAGSTATVAGVRAATWYDGFTIRETTPTWNLTPRAYDPETTASINATRARLLAQDDRLLIRAVGKDPRAPLPNGPRSGQYNGQTWWSQEDPSLAQPVIDGLENGNPGPLVEGQLRRHTRLWIGRDDAEIWVVRMRDLAAQNPVIELGPDGMIRFADPDMPLSGVRTFRFERVAPPAPPGTPPAGPRYGPFYRLESPTQGADVAAMQVQSGELWGRGFRGASPTAQAYRGPLPPGERGVEFYTSVPPDPNTPPGLVRWTGGRDGVRISPNGDYGIVPIEVTNVTQPLPTGIRTTSARLQAPVANAQELSRAIRIGPNGQVVFGNDSAANRAFANPVANTREGFQDYYLHGASGVRAPEGTPTFVLDGRVYQIAQEDLVRVVQSTAPPGQRVFLGMCRGGDCGINVAGATGRGVATTPIDANLTVGIDGAYFPRPVDPALGNQRPGWAWTPPAYEPQMPAPVGAWNVPRAPGQAPLPPGIAPAPPSAGGTIPRSRLTPAPAPSTPPR